MATVVRIDGGQGEGGGQVLRSALALAAVTGTPVEIDAIRRRRPKPGLQPQHLAAARAVARVCGGRLEGAELGSSRVALWPGQPRAGEYRFEVGTAGAATLVLQAVLPVLAAAGGASVVRVAGGTHVPWSPPADYLGEVVLPLLAAMGVDAALETVGWGFYPAGGGELTLRVAGRLVRPLTRLRGTAAFRVRGVSGGAGGGREVARRQREAALRRLADAGHAAEVRLEERPARGSGSYLFLVAEDGGPLGGFSALGRPGASAEELADEAVDGLLAFAKTDAGCDPHLADQLVVPMALAAGTSRLTTSRVTQHLLTVLDLARQLLGCPVQLRGELGEPGSLTLQGTGQGVSPQDWGPGGQGRGVEGRGVGVRAQAQAAVAQAVSPPAHASDGSGWCIRKARAADVVGMQQLLAQFARRGDVLPRTLNEMYQHLRDFFVCEQDGEIVGLVGLYLYWEDLAEVRSLAVKESLGGRGVGSALVRACLEEAASLGVARVFALTNRPAFFERLAFRVLDKRELPQKIWKDCLRCAKFAACDEVALIREAGSAPDARPTT